MKRNLITFIAFSAFLTVGSVACYGQVTINQPAYGTEKRSGSQ